MPPAPLPANEATRLAALRSYDLLDSAAEEVFDDIVALAAKLTDSPIALVSLLDADRQWFKARHGLEMTETPRDYAFCGYTIADPAGTLSVSDATQDARFADNPLVTGDPGIRAYLGVPIITAEGYALGTLCALDRVPRPHSEDMVRALQTLANAVGVNFELRRALRQTRDLAMIDPLTGVLNRRAFLSALSDVAAQGCGLTVFAIDLDHFKETNDAGGHAAGDAVLRAAAARLRHVASGGAHVGRIGGDEFAVVYAGSSEAAADALAREISAALHNPVPHDGKWLRLGATLGIAAAPSLTNAPEEILHAADQALIRAKRKARGCIVWSCAEDQGPAQRATGLLRAFDGSERDAAISVHLQPIVAFSGMRILGLEALGRWTHPDFGDVPPNELLGALDGEKAWRFSHCVRERALRAFAHLRATNFELTGTRLALNVSAGEVAVPDLAGNIETQVAQAGLGLRDIMIEVTEEILLDRVSNRVLEQLTRLHGGGARLVLDDYGAGKSSLPQLLRLPFEYVKLDARFVQRLGVDPRAEEIVRASVTVAHGLGVRVVAEGVETEAQRACLAGLGYDYAQGRYFAPPAEPDTVAAWIEHRKSSRRAREVA